MTRFSLRSSVIQGLFPGGVWPLHTRQPRPHAIQARSQAPVVQRVGGGTAMRLPPDLPIFGIALGQPLPQAVQQKMEAFFGTRFDDVRIHLGAQASAIGALAFTHGSDIYFAPGQYQPATSHGQRLLGHELTHVVQQRAGRVRNPFSDGIAVVQDALLEAEAEQMGARVAAFQGPVQTKMAAHTSRRPALSPSPRFRLPAVQLKPGIGDLKGISRIALREAGGIEFQAMSVDRAVVITSNDALSTQNFCTAALQWSDDEFRYYLGGEIRTHTGVTRGRDFQTADTATSAATKATGGGGFIVLTGGTGGLHAEQGLLLVLAHMMSTGKVKRDVVIAGRNPPCDSCREVLDSFSKWYKLLGYGSIEYDQNAGQGRDRAQLDLATLFPNAGDKLFSAFVERYTRQLAGEFRGSG